MRDTMETLIFLLSCLEVGVAGLDPSCLESSSTPVCAYVTNLARSLRVRRARSLLHVDWKPKKACTFFRSTFFTGNRALPPVDLPVVVC